MASKELATLKGNNQGQGNHRCLQVCTAPSPALRERWGRLYISAWGLSVARHSCFGQVARPFRSGTGTVMALTLFSCYYNLVKGAHLYKDAMGEQPKITNLSEFYNWVKNCHSVHNDEIDSSFLVAPFYRGQSDTGFKSIVPSLYRGGSKSSDLEFRLINKASRMLWSEMRMYSSYTEKLIFLQHYGLPTRLLDITSNPLVALYFACNKDSDKDGEVFSGYYRDKDFFNSELCERIIKYVFSKGEDIVSPQDLGEIYGTQNRRNSELLELPQLISPPLNNPRLQAQSGAFLMAPLVEFVGDNTIKRTDFRASFVKLFENSSTIPHGYKSSVLKELDEIGINEATLFPEIEHKLRYINEIVSHEAIEFDVDNNQ